MEEIKYPRPESITDGDANLEKKGEVFLKVLGSAQFDERGDRIQISDEVTNADLNLEEKL